LLILYFLFLLIFLAEIASTFNEMILSDFLMKNNSDKEFKIFLIDKLLEKFRTTFLRQTIFAEFELEMHKFVESGNTLTAKWLENKYLELTKYYYGDNEGIVNVNDFVKYEWAYIPHFYYNYYVYQYATSIIYATAFYEKIKEDGDAAVQDYFKIIKGGGSDYPIELIKKAGVDPMSAEPFELAMKRMNDVMDKIEAIIKK